MRRLDLLLLVSLSLVGCRSSTSLVRALPVAAGQACRYGGLQVQTGLDLDDNGQLDPREVRDTQFVCNQWVDGKSSLVNVQAEPSGANCRSGGFRLDVGLDDDGNGQLEAGEIDSSKYVCHGDAHLLKVEKVESGPGCVAGGVRVLSGFDRNGNSALDVGEVQGTEYVCNGRDGEDGKSTVVKVSAIPASAQGVCFFGGSLIESGLDLNRNGVLEATEVTSSRSLCSVQVNQNLTLVKTSAIVPGAVCTYGGVRTEVGIDDNDNHTLEPTEVDSTTDQCSTAIIVDGLTTLTTTSPATAAQCAFGGYVLFSGLDDNRNGTLESSERDSTAVLCNGANGFASLATQEPYTGSSCASGTGTKVSSGLDLNRDGTLQATEVQRSSVLCNGATGDDGIDSLIRTANAGSACGLRGGVRVEVGKDANHNGTLDQAEVTGTSYVCNGLNGLNSLVAMDTAGTACGPRGGTLIVSGLDLDQDGVLDQAEVETHAYVCNGYDGYSGAVATSTGTYAACGGQTGIRVLSGLDLDNDGVLDANEVEYENYVCF